MKLCLNSSRRIDDVILIGMYCRKSEIQKKLLKQMGCSDQNTVNVQVLVLIERPT